MKRILKQQKQKLRRRKRGHARVRGTSTRPRLSIFRSNRHISAQLIDDDRGITVGSASDIGMKDGGTLRERAEKVGVKIAERAKAAGVTAVRFDRGGYRYHGAVKSLADAARAAGLHF